MIILSHRGFWSDPSEKNTIEAFKRSFLQGFGIETDIRDRNGDLVVSHDPANDQCMLLDDLLAVYVDIGSHLPLALNIKSDGLSEKLKIILENYNVINYFVFDMAVPDGIQFIKSGLIAFTRHSEYEPVPPYYEMAAGVWLDEFNDHWLSTDVIEKHIESNKKVCVVSPELHNRQYVNEWDHYRKIESYIGKNKIMLCTDFPEKAEEFFNG